MSGRIYSRKELAAIRRLYPHMSTTTLARETGRSKSGVYGLAAKLGLSKTAKYLASPAACRLRRGDEIGKASRFQKGHVPANKGVRRPGFSPGRMAETQFKKGESTNKMAVGSTRMVEGYVYRKVSEIPGVPWTRNWRLDHHLVWEKAGHRPINIHTHALIFKDGDRLNTKIDNLKRITRTQLMARNSVHNLPPELKEIIRLRSSIKRVITRRTRKANRAQEQTQRPARPSLRDPGSASRQGQPDGHPAGADDQHGSADAG